MKLSIIICTYNSPNLINRCVKSILNQTFKNYEILLVDGGSDKKTLETLKKFENKYKNIRLIKNPAKLPEGTGRGKWLGFRESIGEIFGVIDQDNELIGKDCLKNLIKPFENKEIFGVACRLYLKKKDNLTNQIISLMGTDGFLAYRSLDYLINTNKLNLKETKEYSILELKKDNLIVTGGNCFFYRREFLENVGGYVQDVDNILNLIKKGYKKIAIANNAFTHHHAVKGFSDFLKKKKKWGQEYESKKREFSWFPQTKLERKEFILNVFKIIFIFPMFVESFKLILKTKKIQGLMLPLFKFSNFFVYVSSKSL